MLNILTSQARTQNDSLKEDTRAPGEDNVAWLARNVAGDGEAKLILLGGRSRVAMRLRIAQAHARHDLSPSHWSHVLLLVPGAGPISAATRTLEIPLDPPSGFGFPPSTNGVQVGSLEPYRDVDRHPNIAALSVPVPIEKVIGSPVEATRSEDEVRGKGAPAETPTDAAPDDSPLRRFKRQRAALDTVELLVGWLAFVWGVGKTGNPLLEGYGIPSAAFIEVVVDAAGFDLTPGVASRSTCPEAIWQSAIWWHEYHAKHEAQHGAIRGTYHIEHKIC